MQSVLDHQASKRKPPKRKNGFDWSAFDAREKSKLDICDCGTGLPRYKCVPEHARERSTFRSNVTSDPRSFRFAAFDLETKRRDRQDAGFDDPFLCGLDDGTAQYVFENSIANKKLYKQKDRAFAVGGCIRRYLDHILVPRYAHHKSKDGFGGWVHVAHNGGRFDFNHLLRALTKLRLDYKLDVIVNGDRIISITVTRRAGKKKLKWVFWDSGLPLSLARLGEIVGSPKLVETDLNMHEDDHRWHKYVKQDCKTLRIGMEMFQQAINDLGGQWKPTLPGTAIDLFRRRSSAAIDDGQDVRIRRNRHFAGCPDLCGECFNVKCRPSCKSKQARDLKISDWKWDPHIQTHIGDCPWAPDGCAHFFFRRAFFGGRTELFRQNYCNPYFDPKTKVYNPPPFIEIVDPITKQFKTVPYRSPFRIYDINSSYPASMLSGMPVGMMASYTGRAMFDRIWPRVLSGEETRIGFIECTVFVPDSIAYPPLPVRSDGKVKFPTGYIQGVWTSNELHEAVRLGCIIREVNQHAWIGQRAVFREMINDLWAMRKEAKRMTKVDPGGGHAGRAEVYKLIMNSFFGKWSMGEYRDDFIFADDLGLPDGCTPVIGYEQDYGRRVKHVEEDYIIPSVAAVITSQSRLRLLRSFQQVETSWNPFDLHWGLVWYTDTDSIHCDVDLPESDELGALKREYDKNEIVYCRYDTAKTYEAWMVGDCPDSCSQRVINKETKSFDKPCGHVVHKIVKSKGIQDPSSEKLADLRAGKTLAQRAVPKFRKLLRHGFEQYRTIYTDEFDENGKPLASKSATMKYDKRTLDKITGVTTAEFIQIDQVVHAKRAKSTPNLRKFDQMQMSVKDIEALWRSMQPQLAYT